MNLVKFWKVGDKYGFCSNWYKSRFTIDDVDFSCVEQYMMYQKAVLFNDKDIANKVLNTDIPKEIKALGRQVKNFDSSVWDKHKYDIVRDGVLAKFTQNKDLQDKLLSVDIDSVFVECSPLDKIWGIGLAEDNPLTNDMSTWQGENLLGKAITEVFHDILKSKNNNQY